MRAALFHNVITGTVDPFDRALSRMSAPQFADLIDRWMAQYDIVSFANAMARRLAPGGKPAMHLTFDDGFAGVYEHALPILKERGLVASVFILTDGESSIAPAHLLHFEELELAFRYTTAAAFDGASWGLGQFPLDSVPNRVNALRRFKTVIKLKPDVERIDAERRAIEALGVDLEALAATHATTDRFRKLSFLEIHYLLNAGWTIGGHTRTHPVLSALDNKQIVDEINGNARDLAHAFGLTDAPFAYPFGGRDHVDTRAVTAARQAGFACAFTTVPGPNGPGTELFELHRYSVTDLQVDQLRGSLRPPLPGGDG
jgi:peptidoglycan/xylan/chitin deacetylase (PgdA/CDA1 family)